MSFVADYAGEDGEKFHVPEHIKEQEAALERERSVTTINSTYIEQEIALYTELFEKAYDVRNIDTNLSALDLKASIKACINTADVYETRLNYYKTLLASIDPSAETGEVS